MNDTSRYEPPIPIDRNCLHCYQPLVVTASGPGLLGTKFTFAHASDLATECVRVLRNEVKPYSGWNIDDQVAAEQQRRRAAEDEEFDRQERAAALRRQADELAPQGGAA